jgi:hypothetical protein
MSPQDLLGPIFFPRAIGPTKFRKIIFIVTDSNKIAVNIIVARSHIFSLRVNINSERSSQNIPKELIKTNQVISIIIKQTERL